jgi:hypothetical protein
MSGLLRADVRQPLAQTAHGRATDSLKEQIEDRVCDPTNALKLDARLVGDAGTRGSRDEGDLVYGAKGGVTSAQDQVRRPFELGDPVLERNPSPEKGDRHPKPAAEPDLAPRDATSLVHARIPLGGPAEIGEVIESLLDGDGEVDRVDVAGHVGFSLFATSAK